MKKYAKILMKLLKWGIILAILAVIGIIVYQRFFASQFAKSVAEETVIQTAEVETRDIRNVLSSSGSIEPLNSYEVTTLVEGEVIAADFEEGDIVQEGQVLYQIATDTLDSKIDTSETAVTRAKKEYTKAANSYQEALDSLAEAKDKYQEAAEEYSNINVTSTATGIVKNIFVEVGDTIQKGSQIAEIYDNSTMLLTVLFSASEVDPSLVGKKAEVVVDDTFESLEGKVVKVSNIEEALSGNRLVKEVTIEVANPGGLTEQTQANAIIGDIYSMDAGTFSVKTNTVIKSDLSGEIAFLNLEEGDSVKEGDIILTISEDDMNDQLENYSNAIDNAQNQVDNAKDTLENKEEAIEDAESALQEVIDTRTDYSITSPVTGKIITKNILKGDTIGSGNFNSTLCVIYDLSAVTFDMFVDELDVMKVAEGQEVNITADALEGAEIKGVVTNVSLESTTSQGVTQYPVTVRIDEVGDLLPGMNVTGEIIIEEANGVLAIPSDCLQRGDQVYVKDASVTEEDGFVPAGFRAVSVTTGITDGDYIEITGGLTGGEIIYLTRTTSSGITGFEDMMGNFNMNGMDRSQMPSGGMPSGDWGGGNGSRPSGDFNGGAAFPFN